MNKKFTVFAWVAAFVMFVVVTGSSSALFAQYCAPTNNTNGDIYYISNVVTTGGATNISNTSTVTNSVTGYSDYTAQSVTVPIGGSFGITCDAYLFTYKWAIWVDWNQDGDFDDTDETPYSYLSSTGLMNISTTVTVPSGASSGATRMRIRILRDWSAEDLTPCALDLYGEVEDYTVIVGSNDCSGAPAGGSTTAASTAVDCGNTTMLGLSGATGGTGITYQWQYNITGTWVDFGTNASTQSSTAITGMVQFRCLITCTNSGESAYSDPVTVNATAAPLSVFGNDTAICEGGSLVLDAGPGATYQWSTGATTQTITVADAGTYSVTVTNGLCSGSDTILVTLNPAPEVDLGSNASLCAGETITLDAGAIPGATYNWSTGATAQTISVSAAGVYSVTVTVNDCSASDEVTIFEGDPTVDGISVTGISPTYSFSAVNPQSVTSYSWNFGDGIGTSTGANPSYSYTPGTTVQSYTVTLVVSNNCGEQTTSRAVTVDPATGVNDLGINEKSLKVFPNPADRSVAIQNETGYKMKNIIITNVLGQKAAMIPVENDQQQIIDVTALSSGLYYITVEFEEGREVRKLEIVK